MLIEAPAVLGWDTWRAVGLKYGLGLTEAILRAAMDAGRIAEQPVRPLAHVLIGALDEAALYVARADDPAAARERDASGAAAGHPSALRALRPGLRPVERDDLEPAPPARRVERDLVAGARARQRAAERRVDAQPPVRRDRTRPR